jgi:hypothetical protein
MKRRVAWALVAILLTVCAGSGQPPAGPPAERSRQFRQDAELLDTLVDGAIELAGEEDPLKRAAQCNKLADSLAREIRQAGADHDRGRVAQLGPHLRAMLSHGVAANLTEAKGTIASGTVRERKLLEFSKLVRQMEDDLGRAPGADPQAMKPAIAAMRAGRADVEKAIRGQGMPRK